MTPSESPETTVRQAVQRRQDAVPFVGTASVFVLFMTAAAIVQRLSGPINALSVLLLGATTAPLVYRRLAGTLDLFEPIQLIAALFAMCFAIRALCLFYDPFTYAHLGPYSYDDMIPVALEFALAGFAALVAGYAGAGWFLAKVARPGFRPWPERAPFGRIVTLMMVGALATARMVAGGNVVGGIFTSAAVNAGTFSIMVLAQCVQFSAAICAIYLAGARKPSDRMWLRVLLYGVLFPMSGLQTFVFGAKSNFLITLFMVVGAFNYAGRRRLRLTTAAVAVVVVLVVVFPAVNIYRSGIFRIGATSSAGAFVTSLGNLGGRLYEGGLLLNAEFALQTIVVRSHGVDSLSLLIKYGDRTDIAHPLDYLLVPAFAFVPRAVWPSKPTSAAATRFTRAFVVPPEYAADIDSGPSFGIFHIGDLYICFGVGGMLAGLFVLGVMYRGLYWRYDPTTRTNRRGIFMFVAILWLVINGFESDVPTVYANILKTAVVLGCVSAFVAGFRPMRKRAGGFWRARPRPRPRAASVGLAEGERVGAAVVLGG